MGSKKAFQGLDYFGMVWIGRKERERDREEMTSEI